MDMVMSFFVSSKVSHILFEGWSVSTDGGMVGSCIAVICIAILFETIKSYKAHRKSHKISSETTPLIRRANQDHTRFETTSHLKKTFLYMVQFLIGYFLMLIAMTYNVWLFLAVIAGCGIGYFLVDPCLEYYLAQHNESASQSSNVKYNKDSDSTNVSL